MNVKRMQSRNNLRYYTRWALRWARLMTRAKEMRNKQRILAEKTLGESPFRRPRKT
jgi:hypothetical protein